MALRLQQMGDAAQRIETAGSLAERVLGYLVVKYARLGKVPDLSPHNLRHRFGYRLGFRWVVLRSGTLHLNVREKEPGCSVTDATASTLPRLAVIGRGTSSTAYSALVRSCSSTCYILCTDKRLYST